MSYYIDKDDNYHFGHRQKYSFLEQSIMLEKVEEKKNIGQPEEGG